MLKTQLDIIFLANPLLWDIESRPDIKPALNLLYLASYINSKGLRAEIIDAGCKNIALHDAAEMAAARTPRFLGVAFYQGSSESVLSLCAEVKKIAPSITIIGGGPLMTASAGKIMGSDAVDIGVIGEGELSLFKILTAAHGIYDNIDGIAYKKAGRVFLNAKHEYIENLDELPFLDYSLIDMEPYFKLQKDLAVPRSVFMTTSRGCAYRCTYCASPFLWPGKVRRHSVKRIIDEIKFQTQIFGKINIGFLDDSFFADRKWVLEFFEEIEKIGANYSCIGRADHLDEEKIKRLAETGCNFVSMGVETGSRAKQIELKKFLDLDTVMKNVALFHKYNIYCRCFFMIGFPDETLEEMAETINFAVELKKNNMRDCTFFVTNLYAGTEMSKRFEDSLWKTQIYHDGEKPASRISKPAAPKDFSDEKFSRYSSVPAVNINPYLNNMQLVELVKTAYRKINAMEYISAAEIAAFRSPAVNSGGDIG